MGSPPSPLEGEGETELAPLPKLRERGWGVREPLSGRGEGYSRPRRSAAWFWPDDEASQRARQGLPDGAGFPDSGFAFSPAAPWEESGLVSGALFSALP